MASVKFVPAKGGLSGILDYVTNREKTIDSLITGVNCVAETALHEFNAVKNQFGKTDGRAYYAVSGLTSIFEALLGGDNSRFHLETVHHSENEIKRILARGGKIDRTATYAVADEDEEYEQFHGMSM